MHFTISVPDGCCAGPDPTRVLLEKIVGMLEDVQVKLAAQGEQITALRTYVTGIETAVKELASGEVLPPAVQEKLTAILATIDANSAGIVAAGDGDATT